MPPTTRTRRGSLLVVAAAASVLLTSACSGAAAPSGGDAAAAPGKDDKLTLTVYSKFTDREYGVVTAGLNKLKAKFPNIEIKHEGNQDDDKLTQSIRGGNPPDVAISFYTDNLGAWCSTGSFQDLKPYIERDKIDLNQIPDAVRNYTEYQGKRCAMPMLADVYGMYYNTDMFAAKGITSPPKTMSELFEDTKKLTEFNPDGSIKVAGFLPSMPFYANQAQYWAQYFGAPFLGPDGKSDLATNPGWKAMFEFQKQLIDFYGGHEKVEKFKAGLGDEYSADHGFHKGKLAMIIDGEFRTAFLKDQAPDVKYQTAPFPVLDSMADHYGGGFTTGTIIAIPKGAKNPGAAWELIKQVTLDTDTLVEMANGLKNVPSTKASLTSPKLDLQPQFKTFLDIYDSGKLVANQTTPIGDAHLKAVNDFAEKWQAGSIPDLTAGLAKVDAQVNDELKQKGAGG
ncbi:extracellular solute-binding protein [Amycolatopsis australiensis]|uniref:Probable sugar-binding periplasmic protein n=1 Tax=Amycolatopsis australiensis TaxID=546364 RepID=A0A1K1T7H6_9PSEU|nr:extracellular solute-binding protein [Amycolatopsis australiensis]SFW92492.1 carbohydrate ABC transporter substrate-binding protein, CUT1 family [Amycolatopsis australiensis]